MPELVEDNAHYLVGRFANARVQVGNAGDAIPVHPASFDQVQHEISWNGNTYRFINPDMIAAESLEIIRENHNAFVFEGDLEGVLINITPDGVSAEYNPD